MMPHYGAVDHPPVLLATVIVGIFLDPLLRRTQPDTIIRPDKDYERNGVASLK